MKAIKSASQALIVVGLFAGLAFMAVGCSKPEAAPEAPAAVELAPVDVPADIPADIPDDIPEDVPAEPEVM